MKKGKLAAMFLALALVVTATGGCKKASDAPPAEEAAGVKEEQPTAEEESAETEETEEAVEEEPVEEEEALSGVNTLVLAGTMYTDMENLRNDNNDDGTYFYEDLTEDGVTVITNMCAPSLQTVDQDPEEYAKAFITAEVDPDAFVDEIKDDETLSAKFTYPTYRVSWTGGSNEDTRQALGVVVLTDNYTFYHGFSCSIDEYDDNASFYDGELDLLDLIDSGEPVSDSLSEGGDNGDHTSLYLAKVDELTDEGYADQFALIDIDGDSIPELIASDSKGSFDHDNSFVFTVYDGAIAELASAVSGLDGASISFSAGNNIIRQTGGMAGVSDTFSRIEDGALSEVFTAEMIRSPEPDANGDEVFTYSVNGKDSDAAGYFEAISGFVKDYEPLTDIRTEGLTDLKYKNEGGNGYFEASETAKYMSADEVKDALK